jgi:putative membrane protein
MYGPGYGMGFGWIWGALGFLLLIGALVALILLVVRQGNRPAPGSHQPPASMAPGAPGGPVGPGGPARSNARAIAEERLARGEITPEEYREIVRALDETASPPGA